MAFLLVIIALYLAWHFLIRAGIKADMAGRLADRLDRQVERNRMRELDAARRMAQIERENLARLNRRRVAKELDRQNNIRRGYGT